jgi:hypothetical protein
LAAVCPDVGSPAEALSGLLLAAGGTDPVAEAAGGADLEVWGQHFLIEVRDSDHRAKGAVRAMELEPVACPSGERSRGELEEDGAGVSWSQRLHRRGDDVRRRLARCGCTAGKGAVGNFLSKPCPLTGLQELICAGKGAIKLEGGDEASPRVEDPVDNTQALPAHSHQPWGFRALCSG